MKITKIFYSIQGEGSFSGVASIFVRLFGCNLACDFCDDIYHVGDFFEFDLEQILKEFKKYPSKTVVITGGEPSLYDINDEIKYLQKKGYYICVETNGYNFKNIQAANWITYSPKDLHDIKTKGFDEVKFICSSETDMNKILSFVCDKPIYIQPQNYINKINTKNLNFCIEFVKQNPRFKLSTQLHKFLGIQ